MLTQAGVPGTDDWWLFRLATEMGEGFERLGRLRRYREGDAMIPEEMNSQMREATRRFLKLGRLHMADLVVNAKVSRQKVLGFRTAAERDDLGDDEAAATWRRGGMSIKARDLFADIGHYGSAYGLVDDTEPAAAFIIGRSPWEVYGIPDRRRPWMTAAAIIVGYDELAGRDVITLCMPGYVRSAYREVKSSTIRTDGRKWRPGTDWTWEGPAQRTKWPDHTGVVKLEAPDGVGFYEKHTDTIDRINEGIKQRVVIVAMQAFRQRALKGKFPRTYPADHELAGEPINYDDIFQAGPAALWLLGDGTEIWESAQTQIGEILNANKDDKKDLAAVTGTPLYMLQPDAAAGSAEGASVVREANAFGVEDLNDRADFAFAQLLALAFQSAGDTVRADPTRIETIWASIDRSSMQEKASAASQAAAAGMPVELIDELIWGLTPAQMRRAQQYRADAALLKSASAVTPDDPAVAAAAPPAAADPAGDAVDPMPDEIAAA